MPSVRVDVSLLFDVSSARPLALVPRPLLIALVALLVSRQPFCDALLMWSYLLACVSPRREDMAMAQANMPRVAPASDSQASRATQPSPPQRPPAPRHERGGLHPPRAESEPAGLSPEGQRLGEERRKNEEQKLAEERRVVSVRVGKFCF